MCHMESRIHGIGRVLIVSLLEVCRKGVPVGAKDIEASSRDHIVSISEQWTFPTARQEKNYGLRSDGLYERTATYQNSTPAAKGGITKILVTFVGT